MTTDTSKMPKLANSWSIRSPKMVTMRWICPDPASGAELARNVVSWVSAALVWWEGLPLWQATFHVALRKHGEQAVLELRLWPQPGEE